MKPSKMNIPRIAEFTHAAIAELLQDPEMHSVVRIYLEPALSPKSRTKAVKVTKVMCAGKWIGDFRVSVNRISFKDRQFFMRHPETEVRRVMLPKRAKCR